MDGANIGDSLSRSVKLALDSGEASTLAEAEQIFAGYQLVIQVGQDVAASPTKQVALLTAINAARRCFLGGVQVANCPDAPLLVPWRRCRTLWQAVTELGGTLVTSPSYNVPRIVIGGADRITVESEFALRVTFDGWCGGVVPLDDGRRLPERNEFTPSGVLAGALAVSEAFQFARGRYAHAGRRATGLSLWRPEVDTPWLDIHEPGPQLSYLPSQLWMIGLGHLGQAFLWTLGFLPYAHPNEVLIVLQDYDSLIQANDSTSLLTRVDLVGQRKTRAMAGWCEQRGFRTRIQERRFAANFKIDNEEPRVALCGVDNAMARAALEDVGFAQVIEAGLGLGTDEYLAFQMHCFPSSRSALARWGGTLEKTTPQSLINQPAYKSLSADGLDQCGLTLLAGRSVGAAFVGAMTSTLVVAELLRMATGDQRYDVIDGSLRSLQHRQAITSGIPTVPFNPGLTEAMK